MTRGTDDNNEPTRWTSIGWQAALITNRLRVKAQLSDLDKQKNEDTDRKPDAGKAPEKHTGETAAEIERRIRDILAMENRLRRKRI